MKWVRQHDVTTVLLMGEKQQVHRIRKNHTTSEALKLKSKINTLIEFQICNFKSCKP